MSDEVKAPSQKEPLKFTAEAYNAGCRASFDEGYRRGQKDATESQQEKITPAQVIFPAQIERIGKLADKARNYLSAARMNLPVRIHIEGMHAGFLEIAEEAELLWKELGGEE